ncbi:subtilase family serine protease [Sphingomonas sp. F9_3S_D5_B_2]
MSLKTWGLVAFGATFGMAGAAPVAAQSAQAIEHSGRAFHVAVCARGNPRGTARCFAHVVTDARGNPLNGKLSPGATAAPSGYGPNDLRGAYKITTNGSTTIAIVDAGGYSGAESDLAVYRAQYGLPACTTANGCFKKVNQNGVQGSYPRDDTGWAQESALDLDMASAMCPGCKLLLVEANSATLANLAAAVRTAAATPGVTVISNSYGGSESGSTSYESAYNQPGKAVTVSTGDSGYGTQFPASSPHVIAVGGTHLVKAANTRGWSETAWSSGGSGCSTVYGKPGFQSDSLCTMRMEADVSAVGDPATGVAVYGPSSRNRSAWMVFGGTSVSAPLIGGIYGVTGHTPTGAAGIYTNKSQLNDVTSGTNGSCGGTYFCTAGAGYDGPTGNGTPNGPGAF